MLRLSVYWSSWFASNFLLRSKILSYPQIILSGTFTSIERFNYHDNTKTLLNRILYVTVGFSKSSKVDSPSLCIELRWKESYHLPHELDINNLNQSRPAPLKHCLNLSLTFFLLIQIYFLFLLLYGHELWTDLFGLRKRERSLAVDGFCGKG